MKKRQFQRLSIRDISKRTYKEKKYHKIQREARDDMTDDWRKDLSFSDRLAVTSKMQTANPDEPSSVASKYAKTSEDAARKYASSLHDYHEQCNKASEELLRSAPSKSRDNASANEYIDVPRSEHRIGRYSNVVHFENGLFSEVYKATLSDASDHSGQIYVYALKVTILSMTKPPHDAEREARILAATKNSHIIPLHDTFKQPGGRFIMAFPYMPFDLDVLLHGGQLTPQSRKTILRDMFSGLSQLHKLGIIHRDIKPSNILLSTPSGPAYISDFGIAWSPTDDASESADEKITDVGTTCYRPPELLFGSTAYDTSLDLWSAGCVAAQVVCLNGQTLFDAGDLGSELALIKSMFENLGTPDLERWPQAASLPDWGKMNFREYPGMPWTTLLPEAGPQGVDLVSRLVVFESSDRMLADDALKHRYLKD